MTQTTSAAKEPMVWLIFGIPLLTAIAGFFTIYVAISAKATDVVNTPVSRIAQIQQSDLTADEAAARKKLSARLTIEGNQWIISSQHTLSNSHVILELQHPIDKAQDIRLLLNNQNGHFVMNTNVARNHDWLLQLSDPAKQWRLVGRLRKNQSSTNLRASVSLP